MKSVVFNNDPSQTPHVLIIRDRAIRKAPVQADSNNTARLSVNSKIIIDAVNDYFPLTYTKIKMKPMQTEINEHGTPDVVIFFNENDFADPRMLTPLFNLQIPCIYIGNHPTEYLDYVKRRFPHALTIAYNQCVSDQVLRDILMMNAIRRSTLVLHRKNPLFVSHNNESLRSLLDICVRERVPIAVKKSEDSFFNFENAIAEYCLSVLIEKMNRFRGKVHNNEFEKLIRDKAIEENSVYVLSGADDIRIYYKSEMLKLLVKTHFNKGIFIFPYTSENRGYTIDAPWLRVMTALSDINLMDYQPNRMHYEYYFKLQKMLHATTHADAKTQLLDFILPEQWKLTEARESIDHQFLKIAHHRTRGNVLKTASILGRSRAFVINLIESMDN